MINTMILAANVVGRTVRIRRTGMVLLASTAAAVILAEGSTNAPRAPKVLPGKVNTGVESMITPTIDWKAFLGTHNLKWTKLPARWPEAPYLGNGMMGTMVMQSGDQTVLWQVGRGDVQDHRPLQGAAGKVSPMFARNRLPIGYFELNTVGTITGGTTELDLWNAEATGVITTDKGSIAWRSLVHTDRMLIITELTPSEGEKACRWVWHAEPAVSPRYARQAEKDREPYELNPDPVQSTQGDVTLCTQRLLAGGETVTAWREDSSENGRRLFVSVAHTFPKQNAAKEAVGAIEAGRKVPLAQLVETHRSWWHNYYPQSFISLPDSSWEGFYWIQMYKLASATREDRMLLDLCGPWLQKTAWPGVWWNLNIQLTYWPTYTANRLELGASLGRHIYDNVQNLIDAVPEEYRHDSAAVGGATGQDLAGFVAPPNDNPKQKGPMMGMLLWGLHNCWLHYRYGMDDETLRQNLFPILKRAVNYYFHFITEDENKVMHLPRTFSPESITGTDANFDLALLKWGCTALVQTCERLKMDDPLLPKWRDALKRLPPYPVNENGYMLAAGVPFGFRHRHYSHLLMLYPLYLVNADQEGAEELALRSVRHWNSFGEVSHGYAATGASSLFSAFGKGNEALEALKRFKRTISFTTMCEETGGPVIETPLSGAQSILDMILQSWGNTIRVFPAMPDAWADLTFHNLRAEGAFLVSAVREKGETKWVRVKSLAGEVCRIKPALSGIPKASGKRKFSVKECGKGVYELDLKKGEEVLLYCGDKVPAPKVEPLH